MSGRDGERRERKKETRWDRIGGEEVIKKERFLAPLAVDELHPLRPVDRVKVRTLDCMPWLWRYVPILPLSCFLPPRRLMPRRG
jgi:hypothetical protein